MVYSAPMNPAIEVRGVSKSFAQRAPVFSPWRRTPKIHALTNVNFQVPSGAVFVLAGSNGAGKSTLLKILATLILPDGGEVRVHGYSCTSHAHQVRRLMSFAMGEERSFYWRLTPRQNLEFFATLYNLSRKEASRKIHELAETFGIETFLDRPYEQLSTGTRQRLGLVRSFLNDASVLLADEPTRSLDPLSRSELKRLLKRLSREWRKTVLLTTHDLHEAEELADRIGILHQGQLLKVGTPEELRSLNQQGDLEAVFAEFCRG